jgi:hypothetical protein
LDDRRGDKVDGFVKEAEFLPPVPEYLIGLKLRPFLMNVSFFYNHLKIWQRTCKHVFCDIVKSLIILAK